MSERLLRYPDTSRLYSWAELRMLSAALGFPSNLLLRRLPSELVKEEPGVRSQGLRRRLDLDCFVVALDSSHNGKSGIYNVKTLRKCLDLLDCSFFSFAELKEARLAFSAYEALDQRGMRLDLRTLLRALKMCRRAISPLKLAHRIKHLQRGLTEPGRLQLYEFLDLLPLCEVQNQVPLQESRAGATQMTPRHIYKLDEASSLLGPEDRRLWQLLDRRFLSEERDYGPVRAVGGKLTGSPVLRLPTAHQPPINADRGLEPPALFTGSRRNKPPHLKAPPSGRLRTDSSHIAGEFVQIVTPLCVKK
ncbi:uncharacterized protein LOC136711908 [Amia ocellicauda]|uniref:uncharacterized protein LOC136711908 n=1 Tax=Amia ocellicauda TaxID=2972642 RepID=UPI0034642064